MIRAIALVSALALAGPAMAAGEAAQGASVTDKLDAPRSAANQEPAAKPDDESQSGQLSGYWNEVFPLPGESYGMFPQLYGNPHGMAALDDAEEGQQTAEMPGAGTHAGEASGETIDPGYEGPDLRDATGERID